MWIAGLLGLKDRQTRDRPQSDDQSETQGAADENSGDPTRPLAEQLVAGNAETRGRRGRSWRRQPKMPMVGGRGQPSNVQSHHLFPTSTVKNSIAERIRRLRGRFLSYFPSTSQVQTAGGSLAGKDA
jgi:hypothetical protein